MMTETQGPEAQEFNAREYILAQRETCREERRLLCLSLEQRRQWAEEEARRLFDDLMRAVGALRRSGVILHDRRTGQDYSLTEPARSHRQYLIYRTSLAHEKTLQIRAEPGVLSLSGSKISDPRLHIVQKRPNGWEDHKVFFEVERALDWLARVIVAHEKLED
jgi:hypothetical protein